MKKVIIMLFIASLWGSLFAQQGLDYENDSKELTTGQDKYTEIEMNLVDQFHYRYHSRIRGLTFDGEYLWFSEATYDSLIAIDRNTGEKIKGFPSPIESSILGLAFDGENIWASTSHTVYKIDHANGTVITSFNVPYSLASNGSISGLTWHNNTLYCTYTGGFDSKILGIDVVNIICVDTIDSGECSSPTGLTFMNGFFWINDYVEIKVRKVNIQYGQYEGWFPHYSKCTEWVGLANDEEYMYCSDNFCNIYKYEIIDTITIVNKKRQVSNSDIKFNVYPNPPRNMINLDFYFPNESNVTIEVFDMNGILKELIVEGKQYTKGKHIVNWNTKGLVTGEYIVKLTTNTNVLSKKLIIKK